MPRSIKWVCRGLVRWSSLGTFILGGEKKVRALPIHLNSHAVGPTSSRPQPLNIAFETPCAAIIVLFFFFSHLAHRLGFVCIRCPLWCAICSGSQVLQLHTKPQIWPFLFVLLRGRGDRTPKRNSIPEAGSKVLTVACFFSFFFFFPFSGVSTSSQPVCSHQNRQEHHRGDRQGEGQSGTA